MADKIAGVKIAVIITALTAVFASMPSWAHDFTGTDCNQPEIRKALIVIYDDAQRNNISALDIYDQVTEEASDGLLICVGTYELSNGMKLKLSYTNRENSLGEQINSFRLAEKELK
jgi:hypothetical protein